jgi:hypothetical protein
MLVTQALQLLGCSPLLEQLGSNLSFRSTRTFLAGGATHHLTIADTTAAGTGTSGITRRSTTTRGTATSAARILSMGHRHAAYEQKHDKTNSLHISILVKHLI